MSRFTRRTALSLGLLVFAPAAVAACSVADATPRVTKAPTAHAEVSRKVAIAECGHDLVEHPSQLVIACGDGGESLQDLTWSDWGTSSAVATGTINVNSCDPTCADSNDEIVYPVTVAAHDVRSTDDGLVYTILDVDFAGAVPPGYDRHMTLPV